MNRQSLPKWLVFAFSFAFLLALVRSAVAQNGIYADFTTSKGNFSCRLDYTNAPVTVANFIGLATGQRSWLDTTVGKARTNAFYNGLTFHRVIRDFMIQAGSPNGQGTDGPGYAFPDEFSSRTFNRFGVLAMANSGTNSNGAQFFITVTNTPWLNKAHTIFGQIVSGSNVVYAISRVPTDPASGRPFTNVVIHSVIIRRVGTAAQNFNIHNRGLPSVVNLPIQLKQATSSCSLLFTNSLYADNRLFSKPELYSVWTQQPLGIEVVSPLIQDVPITLDQPSRFFRMVQVQYSGSTLSPRSLTGRTMSISFTSGLSGSFVAVFTNSSSGTFTYSGNSGTLQTYRWTQEPYRGYLSLTLSSFPSAMSLKADFTSPTKGRFSGTAYPNYPLPIGSGPVSGTFTLTGP